MSGILIHGVKILKILGIKRNFIKGKPLIKTVRTDHSHRELKDCEFQRYDNIQQNII